MKMRYWYVAFVALVVMQGSSELYGRKTKKIKKTVSSAVTEVETSAEVVSEIPAVADNKVTEPETTVPVTALDVKKSDTTETELPAEPAKITATVPEPPVMPAVPQPVNSESSSSESVSSEQKKIHDELAPEVVSTDAQKEETTAVDDQLTAQVDAESDVVTLSQPENIVQPVEESSKKTGTSLSPEEFDKLATVVADKVTAQLEEKLGQRLENVMEEIMDSLVAPEEPVATDEPVAVDEIVKSTATNIQLLPVQDDFMILDESSD